MRPTGVPLHCLAVDANPTTGLILAYGEFFGFYRFVCLLGEAYEGPAIRKAYAIDPGTGKKLDLTVRITFSREDMEAIYAYKRTRPEDLKRAADAIVGPMMQARMEAAQRQVITKALDEAHAEQSQESRQSRSRVGTSAAPLPKRPAHSFFIK